MRAELIKVLANLPTLCNTSVVVVFLAAVFDDRLGIMLVVLCKFFDNVFVNLHVPKEKHKLLTVC